MPTSLRDFERRLLEAAIEGDPEQDVLAVQVGGAMVASREHTGHGLYVNLVVDERAPKLTTERRDRQLQGADRLVLSHPALEHGAGTIVWVSECRIEMIECFVYDGTWPDDDTAFGISAASPQDREEPLR